MHYTELQLRQLLQSNDGDTIQQSISLEHLENCAQCQKALSELAGEGQWLSNWADQACEENNQQHWDDEEELTAQFVPGTSDCNITVALTPEMKREEGNFTTDLSMVSTDFLQPAVHPELLGRLGRYDVERLVGAGGFGIVFKAHDTELRRVVALKVLAPHLMSSGAARRRFARESQAAAAIVQQHVVPIYDVVSDPEVSYLVMQYVSGGSLQERVDKEGPLAIEDVLRIGMQIAQGLSAAHRQGVVHRDVKPGNILLEDSVDRVLISDFGLARTADDANLTRSGVITGTPHYMSPEQATGSYIDARSDLFSLGSVLFFMLTGRPPFRAPQVIAVLNRICTHRHRPVEHINSSVPLEVAELVDSLLEKDAQLRPQSAEEVANSLQELLLRHQAGGLHRCTKPRFHVSAKEKSSPEVIESKASPKKRKPLLRAIPFAFMAGSILLAFAFGIGVSNRDAFSNLMSSATALISGDQKSDPIPLSDSNESSGNSVADTNPIAPEPVNNQPATYQNEFTTIPGLEGAVPSVDANLLSATKDDALAQKDVGRIATEPGEIPVTPSPGVTIRSEPIQKTPKTTASGKEIVATTKLEKKQSIQILQIGDSEEALRHFNSSFRTRQFGILDNESQQFVLAYDAHIAKLPTYGDLKTVRTDIEAVDLFEFFRVLEYWELNLTGLDQQIDEELKEMDSFENHYLFPDKFPKPIDSSTKAKQKLPTSSSVGPAAKIADSSSSKVRISSKSTPAKKDKCSECDGCRTPKCDGCNQPSDKTKNND